MIRHLLRIALLSISATAMLTACQYKDFDEDYDGTEVKFVYDYSALSFRPTMMRMVVYPLDGQLATPLIRDFADSATVDVPYGEDGIIAFNDDSGILRYYDTRGDKLVITTGIADKNKTAMLDTIPDAEFYDYPDRVAYVDKDSVYIPQSQGDTCTITLKPQEATMGVHLTIEGMRNLQLLTQTEVCLDNCYVAFLPVDGRPDTKTAYVVSPDVNIDAGRRLMTATFNIFGMPTDNGHTLRVAVSGEGFRHVLKFNLDGRIEHRTGSRDIWINLKTDFDIEPIADRSSAFSVDVDEWKNDSTDIQM